MSNVVENKSLHVMIVGAGLSGLMLAILLERLGISYLIFERATEVRPLGKEFTRSDILHFLLVWSRNLLIKFSCYTKKVPP
jgi:hypothetical protein